METIIIIQENGAQRHVKAKSGELLSSVLNIFGAKLDMPCAGKGICKSCAVLVNGERRLACQTKAADGMLVELINPTDIKNIAFMDASVEASTEASIEASVEASMQARNPLYEKYGIAIDIGTTTLCAALFDKTDLVGSTACKNPQTSFGADVISRIEQSLKGGTKELAACVLAAISEMIAQLAAENGINSADIGAAIITGNTAMMYLLMGHNPEALSHAPFAADKLFGEYIRPEDIGLSLLSTAKIYLPRCISAFVGGDITTAAIAAGMCEKDEKALLVDIGTNGEIALWQKGQLTCCSTAAGPAFEGAGILHGVYGIKGAIDHVWLDDGKIHCSTIDAAKAVGVCGSGIIDALAVMLELGVIDETGAFRGDGDYFELADGITITAQDVRKIQLAKGSIRAGMETLLKIEGVEKTEIAALYVAGGFGSFIELKNATVIGLIPPELLAVTKCIGNAAHAGAALLLQDKALINKSKKLAAQAHTVALDSNPIFTDNYMTYMVFDTNGEL